MRKQDQIYRREIARLEFFHRQTSARYGELV